MPKIEKNIIAVIQKAVKGVFPDCPGKILSGIYLETPKEKRFGDLSANISMRLAREMKRPPLEIAEKIAGALQKEGIEDIVKDIKIEKPGFINFYLSNKTVISALKEILSEQDKFGHISTGKGKKVQIEFVSANPTGPLTVAHGRQAAIGDSLARILEAAGYKVTKEYYINDEGVQMNLLGQSLKARVLGLDLPENGYKGAYIAEIAKEISPSALPVRRGGSPEPSAKDAFCADYAYKKILATIKKDLEDFGVLFDVWFSQKALSKSGKIPKVLSILKKKGFIYEKDGATWFQSTKFGDDKDRVIIKSDGAFTYLTPDIAYHNEKFKKGYDRVINIWGPDHHGYINRLKAACHALGFDKDSVSILIAQLVTLYRDKKIVPMSTREGEFITLREVMNEVGKDAARFFFIMRKTDSHLDFDLELAKAKTMDNPVYYIQYAHARISSVIKFHVIARSEAVPAKAGKQSKLELLDKEHEIGLIKMLMSYPKIIETSARNLEPYTLLAYLQDLASHFHSYYDAHRIVTEDKDLTNARILLIQAVKTVLGKGLSLLGVSAPEKM